MKTQTSGKRSKPLQTYTCPVCDYHGFRIQQEGIEVTMQEVEWPCKCQAGHPYAFKELLGIYTQFYRLGYGGLSNDWRVEFFPKSKYRSFNEPLDETTLCYECRGEITETTKFVESEEIQVEIAEEKWWCHCENCNQEIPFDWWLDTIEGQEDNEAIESLADLLD